MLPVARQLKISKVLQSESVMKDLDINVSHRELI